MDAGGSWTLDDLVRRVGVALAGSAEAGTYSGAPNGRVRELPDQRMIRWYTSIGLVDRPIGGRGRGARYGERHLRQLVAVKHLQAQGLPLAEIQARLAGGSDDDLARLAPLPAEALAAGSPSEVAAAPGSRLDRAAPRPGRFWAPEGLGSHSASPSRPAAASPDQATAEPLTGLRLAPGVLLILAAASRPAGPADLAVLAEAARPLLAALIDRGLLPSAPLAEPTEGAHR